MSWRPGLPELLVILAIVILLFGGGRIKNLAKELGESISVFKKASSGETDADSSAILNSAKKMGIDTDGKSMKQILEEMSRRAE